jgi:hypothetical protein
VTPLRALARGGTVAALLAAVALAAAGCRGERRTAVLRNDPAARRDLGDRVEAVVQVMAASPAGIRHGSGFVVDEDGVVITTADLLRGASTIFVRFPADDAYFRAAPLVVAERERLGALRIDGSSFPALPLDPRHRTPVGSRVTAVGSAVAPAGAAHTALVRQRLDPGGYYLLESPSPLPAAAAGGPVFDSEGAVVGALARWTLDGRTRDVAVPAERIAELIGSASSVDQELAVAGGVAGGRAAEPRWRTVRPRGARTAPAPDEPAAPAREEPAAPPRSDPAAAARPDAGAPTRSDPAARARSDPAAPARPDRGPPPERDGAAAPEADLSGTWIVTNVVRDHPHAPFRGLRLGFRFDVVQEGSRVRGRGEKVAENGRTLGGGARSPISFDGRLDGRTLTATFRELGAHRTITGVFAWTVAADGRTLHGSFHDTTLGAGGSSSGRRG